MYLDHKGELDHLDLEDHWDLILQEENKVHREVRVQQDHLGLQAQLDKGEAQERGVLQESPV